MKYQQVSVDFVNMVMTACTYLALAGVAWIFLRLVQACFWLRRHLKKQNEIPRMLEEKVESYEKYLKECEERDAAEGLLGDGEKSANDGGEKAQLSQSTDKWKEQRECLEMLKRELKRVRDGDDVADWDYLLEEEQSDSAGQPDNRQPEGGEGILEDEAKASLRESVVNEEGHSEVKKEK